MDRGSRRPQARLARVTPDRPAVRSGSAGLGPGGSGCLQHHQLCTGHCGCPHTWRRRFRCIQPRVGDLRRRTQSLARSRNRSPDGSIQRPADDRWRSAVGRAASTATAIGLVVGAVCLLVGLAIGGLVGPGFAALGLTLPGLLLQDSWRIAFFAAGKGQRAFTNDVVWAISLVPAMLIAGTVGTTFGFVLAWGAAATAAAVFG